MQCVFLSAGYSYALADRVPDAGSKLRELLGSPGGGRDASRASILDKESGLALLASPRSVEVSAGYPDQADTAVDAVVSALNNVTSVFGGSPPSTRRLQFGLVRRRKGAWEVVREDFLATYLRRETLPADLSDCGIMLDFNGEAESGHFEAGPVRREELLGKAPPFTPPAELPEALVYAELTFQHPYDQFDQNWFQSHLQISFEIASTFLSQLPEEL